MTVYALLSSTSIGHAQKAATLYDRAVRDPYAIVQSMKEIKKKTDDLSTKTYPFINTCMYEIMKSADSRRDSIFLDHLNSIAGSELLMARSLSNASYPEELWRDDLTELTKKQVSTLAAWRAAGKDLGNITAFRKIHFASETALINKLNAFRKATNNALPELLQDNSPDCGAGPIGSVRLALSPSGGTIKVIPEFYFQLCQRTVAQPYSDDCSRWQVAGSTLQIPVGTYRYLARWRLMEECGLVDFSTEGVDEEVKRHVIKQTHKACEK